MSIWMFRRVMAGALLVLCFSGNPAFAGTFIPANEAELISSIIQANSNGEDDAIDLQGQTFSLTVVNSLTDGQNGLPSITEAGFSLTIQNGTIQRIGVTAFRLLHVAATGTLILSNVTLANGLAVATNSGVAEGGAIFSRGTLTSADCSFSANVASGSNGLLPPTDGLGGAIYLAAGSFADQGSTFAANQAAGGSASPAVLGAGGHGRGGAIYAAASSSITQILNSVFSSNQAIGGAAAVAVLTGNAAGSGRGGALYFESGSSVGSVTAQLTSNQANGGAGVVSVTTIGAAGAGHGGAVYSDGVAWNELVSSTVSQNESRGGGGAGDVVTTPGAEGAGAVYINSGSLGSLRQTTFSGNLAIGGAATPSGVGGSAFGGALFVGSGGTIIDLAAATFDQNQADGDKAPAVAGGAIYNHGSLALLNVTLNSNEAQCATCAAGTQGDGGAIYNTSVLTLTHGTVSENLADRAGGGIFNAATASIRGSIVADNSTSAGGNNCSGAITDDGDNLSNDATCGFGIGNNTDPKLSASGLQNNGGPTRTILLESDSPALDAIAEIDCVVAVDQRGFTRPADGPDPDSFALCDIGAVELAAAATPTSTTTRTPTFTATATPTSTATQTPTSTASTTPTSTPSDTPTQTPTVTPTQTPTSPSLLANGSLCATSDQCASSFCVQGVCCNVACAAAGQSCTVPGRVGSCELLVAVPVGSSWGFIVLALALCGYAAMVIPRKAH